MIAADTETCPFRKGLLVPPLVCVPFATSEGESDVVLHSSAKPLCERLLRGSSIWANASYDLAVIGNQFRDLIPLVFEALTGGRIYDVLIRQKLIDIAHGTHYGFYRDPNGKHVKISYSVASVAKRLLGVEVEKDNAIRLNYAELRDTPVGQWPSAFYEYSKKDAEILLPIFSVQEEMAEVLEDQFAQSRASMALHLMAAWGIRTDRKAVQELDDRTRAEWEAIAGRLKEHGLIQKSGARNTKLAKAMLIEAVGEDRCKLTITGERKNAEGLSHAEVVQAGYVKLDEESCVDSGDVVLKDYARFGSLIKLRSTYVSALWGGVDRPIQSRFETILDTGRTSSSSPNLQNLPRDPGVRECFVPRRGNVFVFSDYSLAELCSLAQTCIEVCGYSKLAERLNAGFDPHTDMAAQLLGISYEAALALHKSKDKAFKEIRTLAKAANFGFPGGLGPLSFIAFAKSNYGVVVTEAQAMDLKAKWTRAWPEMFDYFKWIGRLTDGGSAWIRHPISRRCRGNISFTVCANSFFQGRTADGAKAALWEVCRRQYSVPSSDLYGTHTVAFIHDEIGIEVEEERCHEAAMELEKVMVEEFCRFHPDLVPAIAASPSVSRRWYKEAPQIWQNEKLIPWG